MSALEDEHATAIATAESLSTAYQQASNKYLHALIPLNDGTLDDTRRNALLATASEASKLQQSTGEALAAARTELAKISKSLDKARSGLVPATNFAASEDAAQLEKIVNAYDASRKARIELLLAIAEIENQINEKTVSITNLKATTTAISLPSARSLIKEFPNKVTLHYTSLINPRTPLDELYHHYVSIGPTITEPNLQSLLDHHFKQLAKIGLPMVTSDGRLTDVGQAIQIFLRPGFLPFWTWFCDKISYDDFKALTLDTFREKLAIWSNQSKNQSDLKSLIQRPALSSEDVTMNGYFSSDKSWTRTAFFTDEAPE